MDADRFDTISRAFASPARRRAMLAFGLAGGLGSLLERLDVGAKRKKRKKKKHKKPCRATCTGKVCGPDDCGGSCGDCTAPLTCQSGICACPAGSEACGGACLPLCPASTGTRVVARHPATCECCIRPGSEPCPNSENKCCDEPDALRCCGPACEPLAENPYCQEPYSCDYDIECVEGRRCPDNAYPRLCYWPPE
jgi:hypothetical protein